MKSQILSNSNKFIAMLKLFLVLLSSLEKDEFDRVNGLENAKDIWDTLQRAHEVIKPVKKAKR
jgi:hypothetical protein